MLQFIVDKEGALSDIQAISGPDILKEAALKAISQSPRWKPAMQDRRKVKSYKKQPIVFKLLPAWVVITVQLFYLAAKPKEVSMR